MTEEEEIERVRIRCEDDFHMLNARLEAVSHILAMTVAELKKSDADIVDRISATMDECLRKYLAGDDDEYAFRRAEQFWIQAHLILQDDRLLERLEMQELPRPMS